MVEKVGVHCALWRAGSVWTTQLASESCVSSSSTWGRTWSRTGVWASATFVDLRCCCAYPISGSWW